MNGTINHKGHVFIALLLAVVLASSMLAKPLHILFVHHDLARISPVYSTQATVSNSQETDCPICDFEFCFFIANSQTNLPEISEIYAKALTPEVIDLIVNQTSHNFQLRAPPVV